MLHICNVYSLQCTVYILSYTICMRINQIECVRIMFVSSRTPDTRHRTPNSQFCCSLTKTMNFILRNGFFPFLCFVKILILNRFIFLTNHRHTNINTPQQKPLFFSFASMKPIYVCIYYYTTYTNRTEKKKKKEK